MTTQHMMQATNKIILMYETIFYYRKLHV